MEKKTSIKLWSKKGIDKHKCHSLIILDIYLVISAKNANNFYDKNTLK